MFFSSEKQESLKDNKTESFLDSIKKLGISSIKSYTRGALLGAIINKPDLQTMNRSGIQMVKLDLFRESLTRFFDHFMRESSGLEAQIDYMPVSAFLSGAALGMNLNESSDIYDDTISNPINMKSRLISGFSYSTYSIIEKLSKTNKDSGTYF
ncbi:hypothetical protein CDIK_1842 [Cucumispora dikerogammari]|nr:hypothetical protein CDIK_1842 [Cucumispora dikerogammari]